MTEGCSGFRVQGPGSRVQGSGFTVQGFPEPKRRVRDDCDGEVVYRGWRGGGTSPRNHTKTLYAGGLYRAPAFSFRDSVGLVFWFRVSGFGFRVSGFGFGFRIWGFGFQVSGFGLRVSGFGFLISGCGVQVSGLWVSRFAFRVSRFRIRA